MMKAHKVHVSDKVVFGTCTLEVGKECPQGFIKDITFNRRVVFINFCNGDSVDILQSNYVRAIEHGGY